MGISINGNTISHDLENSAANLGSTAKEFRVFTNGIMPTTAGAYIGNWEQPFESVNANIIHSEGIFATSRLDGNVNTVGTSNVVYGAVFN